MKHQHIIEIIQEYVQTNDTDYALMINGKWGSGKTYFIKNHLMKSLTANKPIYVSFNGLNKIENISTKILISYFNIDEKINLGIDVIQTLLELGDEIKYLNVITKATQGIKAIYKKIKFKRLELSNSVIFIDDLERISSEIKIEDVLGYLNNNFIEHNKIKVVLICDEEVLEKRENGTTPYLKIKEKLINRSVIFTLDVNEFIPDYLRERYSKANNNYYNLLLPQTDWIISILLKANEVNIRTYNFIFDSLLHIIDKLDGKFADNFHDILLFSIMISIEFKNGILKSSYFSNYQGLDNIEDNLSSLRFKNYSLWKQNQDQNTEKKTKEYFEIFHDKYLKNENIKLIFIKTIYNYILTGYLSKEELNIELNEIFCKKKESDVAIEKLYSYFNLEISELSTLIASIKNYLEMGEYHLRIYPSIYFHIFNINKEKIIDFDFDSFKIIFNDSIDKIKVKPDKIPNSWDFVEYNSTITEAAKNNEINEIILKIKRISEDYENHIVENKFEIFFKTLDDPDWGKFIKAYGDIEHSKIFEKIYNFGLSKRIISLKNSGIHKLIVILNDLYLGDSKLGRSHISEKEYLNKIAIEIREGIDINAVDQMKKYFLIKLANDLDRSADVLLP